MTEPFFIAYTHTGEFKSSVKLQEWTASQSELARGKGAKYARVSTNVATGDVVYEAWQAADVSDPGEPRWPKEMTDA
jgi:hypothetical protein